MTNESEQELTTVDDYINYYQEQGFKLVSDSEVRGERNASLRFYSEQDYGDIKIRTIGSKVFTTLMMNGKVVV